MVVGMMIMATDNTYIISLFAAKMLKLKNSAKKPDEPHNKNYQILSQ